MGESLTTDPFRIREVSYAAGLRQPEHAHPGASVTLILAGGLQETVGSREEAAGALSVVYKEAGVRHADRFGPDGARTLQIALRPGTDPVGADRDASVPGWRWLHGTSAVRPMLDLWRVLHSAASVPACEWRDAAWEACAAVADEHVGNDPLPDWVATAREALDDVLPRRISVRRLAELVDVHPGSLSRGFRRAFGCTITAYRRRHRVRIAASMLHASSRDISCIAYAAGFADHPHLCRTFRDVTGLTPSQYRALAPAR